MPTFEGRPVKIITKPALGATGVFMVGVRFEDVAPWEPVPGHREMLKPASGSSKIVPLDKVLDLDYGDYETLALDAESRVQPAATEAEREYWLRKADECWAKAGDGR